MLRHVGVLAIALVGCSKGSGDKAEGSAAPAGGSAKPAATPIDAAFQPRLSSTIGTASSSAYCASVDSAWVEKAAAKTRLNNRPGSTGSRPSVCRVGFVDGAIRRSSTYRTASTTGRLTPKIARQPKAAVASPPITGPRPAPTPSTDPCTPNARPRWRAGTTSRSMACTLGTRPEANPAWSARKVTSSPNEAATIAAAEKTPKPTVAMMARRRAPRTSQSRPARGCPTSIATR